MTANGVHPEAGLVDLLDRVLDRGLVIHADIMITLAGIMKGPGRAGSRACHAMSLTDGRLRTP